MPPRERKPVEKFNFKELGGRNPMPPPAGPPKKPKFHLELKNPDGTSVSFLTTGFMPVLAQPQPNSGNLEVDPAPADPNSGDIRMVSEVTSPSPSPSPVDRRCETCGHSPIVEVDKGTQTDPLVFPYLGPNGYEFVAVPQFPLLPRYQVRALRSRIGSIEAFP